MNVSRKDARKMKANGLVCYSDFGAVGEGKTDDIDAIAAAHAVANQHSLPVKAGEGATYYIGGKNRTAVIRTDTDFGTAAFIIDDTNVQNRNTHVFLVSSGQHDFGYTCCMPERITIENLQIDDSNHPDNYQGPAIFTNFNPQMKDDSFVEKFPYVKTREVVLKNVTTASGKALRISDNAYM